MEVGSVGREVLKAEGIRSNRRIGHVAMCLMTLLRPPGPGLMATPPPTHSHQCVAPLTDSIKKGKEGASYDPQALHGQLSTSSAWCQLSKAPFAIFGSLKLPSAPDRQLESQLMYSTHAFKRSASLSNSTLR